MNEATSITIRDLAYSYPAGDPVLQAVELEIGAGERVAILGPNGSGKTTLALQLNGLLRHDEGSVTIGDTLLDDDTLAEIRRRVGLVFQDPNDQLFMHSVRDDVAFGPANLGLPDAEITARVSAALQAVHATDFADTAPHHLSGGEKRRAAIASVLSMHPEVLVLDEPTSGLDPVGRHELADLLVALPQTQVVITHDLPFALATCPRALVLDGGRICADVATEALLADAELLAAHRLALPFGYAAPTPPGCTGV